MNIYHKEEKPNPDDWSDNVEKLQQMIHETYENIDESKAYIKSASTEEQKQLKRKNKRRRQAIEGFRNEIEDENKYS